MNALIQCLHCASDALKKNGHSRKRVQRYVCLSCDKSFTEILDNRRVPPEVAQQARRLQTEGSSLRTIAAALGYGKTALVTALGRPQLTPAEAS